MSYSAYIRGATPTLLLVCQGAWGQTAEYRMDGDSTDSISLFDATIGGTLEYPIEDGFQFARLGENRLIEFPLSLSTAMAASDSFEIRFDFRIPDSDTVSDCCWPIPFFRMAENALVIWFGYDPAGNLAWFIGAGTIDGDIISVDMQIPSGTGFGPEFDPGAVNHFPWGTLTLKISGCSSGVVNWVSTVEGYGTGQLNMTRLTYLSAHSCPRWTQVESSKKSHKIQAPSKASTRSWSGRCL